MNYLNIFLIIISLLFAFGLAYFFAHIFNEILLLHQNQNQNQKEINLIYKSMKVFLLCIREHIKDSKKIDFIYKYIGDFMEYSNEKENPSETADVDNSDLLQIHTPQKPNPSISTN
ncbi:hypothetical protein DICPUDRAFT_79219 [Dictyostelium purpureum]|uniref:Uncharacterized protein n=1 Tax=Dictyostelium purpureum TaxID=5786 RepID=F0ZLX5_DICPU|nr:uncharacterized protein DICPUDRAFT_79219 [Dictyostelium purpureum]EGC35042.1 hypothetical protein DICPUDRAFT_79219 [Dictyostelium purpureum]|eukprot:XP_003288410.1 hypothetical protein DICPUDRAFT_79219 [Dictyostelium purpureum]